MYIMIFQGKSFLKLLILAINYFRYLVIEKILFDSTLILTLILIFCMFLKKRLNCFLMKQNIIIILNLTLSSENRKGIIKNIKYQKRALQFKGTCSDSGDIFHALLMQQKLSSLRYILYNSIGLSTFLPLFTSHSFSKAFFPRHLTFANTYTSASMRYFEQTVQLWRMQGKSLGVSKLKLLLRATTTSATAAL